MTRETAPARGGFSLSRSLPSAPPARIAGKALLFPALADILSRKGGKLMKKASNIAFIAVSVATILEYLFVCGMFTGPLMMMLALIVGAINVAVSIRNRDYHVAVLYVIAAVSLCMGYWKSMF